MMWGIKQINVKRSTFTPVQAGKSYDVVGFMGTPCVVADDKSHISLLWLRRSACVDFVEVTI